MGLNPKKCSYPLKPPKSAQTLKKRAGMAESVSNQGFARKKCYNGISRYISSHTWFACLCWLITYVEHGSATSSKMIQDHPHLMAVRCTHRVLPDLPGVWVLRADLPRRIRVLGTQPAERVRGSMFFGGTVHCSVLCNIWIKLIQISHIIIYICIIMCIYSYIYMYSIYIYICIYYREIIDLSE